MTEKIDRLTRDNYDSWRVHMDALLTKTDGIQYVNGKIKRPPVVDPTDQASVKAAEEWDYKDKKVRADIMLAISSAEVKQVKDEVTSRDVWLKLEKIYQSKGPARKVTLLKHIMLDKMNEHSDVQDHLRSFFDTVDKLRTIDVNIHPDLLAIMLLYSLPDSYATFRCAIESRDELPNPETLRIKIIEHGDSRKGKQDSRQSEAMAAARPRGGRQTNTPVRDSRGELSRNRTKFCAICDRKGHTTAECYYNKKRESSKNVNEDDNFLTTENAYSSSTANWCIDSGCTSHMCSNKDIFVSFQEQIDGKVNLANESTSKIQGKGLIKLAVPLGNNLTNNVNLNNALYVPDLRTNLMSVGKITDYGHTVTFDKEQAIVKNQVGRTLMTAKRINNLYYINNKNENCNKISQPEKLNQTEIWHQRFGHLNIADLKDLANKKRALGIKLSGELNPCVTCTMGKMTQNPFPSSQNRSKDMLEIVHTDLCGPMRVESRNGNRYCLTFIDDYSRWCEVVFIKHKNQVLTEFQKFKNQFENQTGRKIKSLQSDNGTEFCNKEFDEFLETSGIKRRLTVPHTPQQNGVAERKNRTLLDMARCMLIQSKLPPSFWAEAMHTANHIRNRCPSKILNGSTPFEVWHKRPPIVSYFRIFGSKAYYLDKTQNKGKFQPKSIPCIFLGYSTTSKAYRVWVEKDRKVIVTRDVKFLGKFNEMNEFDEFSPILEKHNEKKEEKQSNESEIEIYMNNTDNKNNDNDTENRNLPDVEDDEFLDATNGDPDSTTVDQANTNLTCRGPGRPKIERSGQPGRPRKIYNLVNKENNTECSIAEECLMTEEIAGIADWNQAQDLLSRTGSPESGRLRGRFGIANWPLQCY